MKEKTANPKTSQRRKQTSDQAAGPDAAAMTIQAKLTVTSASDATETEADQIAGQVLTQMRRPQPEPFQTKASSATGRVSPKLQAPVGFNGGDVSGEIASGIEQSKGGGTPLEKSAREGMGRAFGADFSRVRIHTDQKADTLNRSLQARAFTTGRDIFFGKGEYNPQTDGGQRLIAHELTHVVQQGAETASTVNRAPAQDVIQRNIKLKTAITGKRTFTAEGIKLPLSKLSITADNFQGLDDELKSLSDEDKTFADITALATHLRARLWIASRKPDAAASLDDDDHPDQLLSEMQELQESGLKYTKPRAAMVAQPDFWKNPAIAPYMLNCWQTVLLAAYRSGLIDHKTFVLADKSVAIGRGSLNVMSEAIYEACGENKVEWKPSDPDSVEAALKTLIAARIPSGWVVVVGREGQHVGVSTGNVSAANDADTIEKMGIMASHGHEWIENNTRIGKDLPVSDLRVSTLEDTITHFDGAGGVYWAPLPRKISAYVQAKDFLESLKALS